MRWRSALLTAGMTLVLAWARPAPADWSVRPALEYDRLFTPRSGWSGADGTYSVPLGSARTLWLFSDTFWGDLDDGGRRRPGWRFLHNSLGLQTESVEFRGPIFEPPDGRGWFWVYAGLPRGDRVEVLLGQFAQTPQGEPGWNFEQVGNWIADLSTTTWTASNYRPLAWFRAPDSYGASLLREGEWLYVFGTRDRHLSRSLLLARCRDLDGPWEFRGAHGWGPTAEPGAEDVSNELSVHRTRRGDLLMVSQHGADIQVRRAPEPWGPWSAPETVFRTPLQEGQFTYNAKAHPALSGPRGLLVSYNVNAAPAQVENDATIYRPRFLWLSGEDW